jgi:hypothetical protein
MVDCRRKIGCSMVKPDQLRRDWRPASPNWRENLPAAGYIANMLKCEPARPIRVL